MKIFSKKVPTTYIDVIEINAEHVSTGQIGHYLKKIQEEEDFRHLGYRVANRGRLMRFAIYTLPGNERVIQYFKDRCPAMVENECRALEDIGHSWVTWPSGFQEISFRKNPNI